jgi:hypothetical protein
VFAWGIILAELLTVAGLIWRTAGVPGMPPPMAVLAVIPMTLTLICLVLLAATSGAVSASLHRRRLQMLQLDQNVHPSLGAER